MFWAGSTTPIGIPRAPGRRHQVSDRVSANTVEILNWGARSSIPEVGLTRWPTLQKQPDLPRKRSRGRRPINRGPVVYGLHRSDLLAVGVRLSASSAIDTEVRMLWSSSTRAMVDSLIFLPVKELLK
jgi:hypothetical protein